MENRILGLHHITAIAGSAKLNFVFYTKVLGLRLVKKTVNFDDPGTYHLYFADEVGTPGTILTFFPWEQAAKGSSGAGQATEVVYSVPGGSLHFWKDRLAKHNVKIYATGKRFGEEYISFKDLDGLLLTLIVSNTPDERVGWETNEVGSKVAIKGFHSTTLTQNKHVPTARVLELLGYKLIGADGNRFRYSTDAINTASIVDIIETADSRGVNAAGTIHHIAFRVRDDKAEMEWREKIVEAGYQITQKIDRNYFYSLYFREPGGVLFEIATDNPGFSVDEPVKELGLNLKLPVQYETHRSKIENALPVLE